MAMAGATFKTNMDFMNCCRTVIAERSNYQIFSEVGFGTRIGSKA